MTFLRTHARDFAATAAFLGMAVGFWMAWPPLGLIVPCGSVFAVMVWSHLRPEEPETDA